jgi:glucosamine--fructose-6-phosphate aminotransferase (isomerizing)
MGLRDEILEQPNAARRQLVSPAGAIDAIAQRLRADPVESVVIAARGTSDHAAIYGQYLLGVMNGLSVGLAAPSIVSLYGVEPRFGRSLVIGISQSGASPDIVGVVEAARRQGAPTLAIINAPDSPLGEAAEFVIELAAGPERAVAATKTYSTSLLALARLSVALLERRGTNTADAAAALAGVPVAIEQALAVEPEVEALAVRFAAADRCVVVGRGFEYATAREWALKLKELAQVFADPYSTADFLHGPIALVQPGIPVLAIVSSGAATAGLVDVLGSLRELDVETVVLSDDPSIRALGNFSVALPAGVPEWLRPISSIGPAQLFAYHLTRARGLDPDAPRYLRKVTRTL